MVIALLCDPAQRSLYGDLNEHAHLLLDRPIVASQIDGVVAAIEGRAPLIPMPASAKAGLDSFADRVFAGTIPAVAS